MLEQKIYELRDEAAVRALIRTHGWATLVSSPPGEAPVVSHLPIVAQEPEEQLCVLGHLAKEDAEYHHLGTCPVALIVEGPETYISPAFYPPGRWVPTWNFVVVHLHGVPEPLSLAETRTVLKRTVAHFEGERGTGWSLKGSSDYFESLLPHVTGFRLRPGRVVAKAKLSQDKTPEVIAEVIGALERSGSDRDAGVADWMRQVSGHERGER